MFIAVSGERVEVSEAEKTGFGPSDSVFISILLDYYVFFFLPPIREHGEVIIQFLSGKVTQ